MTDRTQDETQDYEKPDVESTADVKGIMGGKFGFGHKDKDKGGGGGYR